MSGNADREHCREEGYYINSFLDMRMRETGHCYFRFCDADWSVEAIHVVPSALMHIAAA